MRHFILLLLLTLVLVGCNETKPDFDNISESLVNAERVMNQAQLRIPSGQAIFLIKTPEQTNLNYIQIGGTEQCALTLEVNHFHGLYSQMKNNGAKVSEIEDNEGCGLNFYAYDPAGNKLDIWGGWPK